MGALGAFDLDYRRGGFYNWREGLWMLMLNINIRDLILWNSQNGEPFFASNDNTEGGLVIFATIDGPSSNTFNNYGIRVFGSADLPAPPLPGGIGVSADPTGVTVATDQALYVLGDFNRGVAVGGPARQPASLIGDSINVMSQNYWRGAAACHQYCRDGQSVLALNSGLRAAQALRFPRWRRHRTQRRRGCVQRRRNYTALPEDWWTGVELPRFVRLARCSRAWTVPGATGTLSEHPPHRRPATGTSTPRSTAANCRRDARFVYVQRVLF
jgi:hypothetical protein